MFGFFFGYVICSASYPINEIRDFIPNLGEGRFFIFPHSPSKALKIGQK